MKAPLLLKDPTTLCGRQLLVSVQNAEEARVAREAGVRWIDLKNPQRGSLGRPDSSTSREVIDVLASGSLVCHRPSCQCSSDRRLAAQSTYASDQCYVSESYLSDCHLSKPHRLSVAMGELKDLDLAAAGELMELYPITKVGLAGLGDASSNDPHLQSRLADLQACAASQGQIVLALYADNHRADSPSADRTLELAAQVHSQYVLIDTFLKDGQGLFHWMSPGQINQLQKRALKFGARLVIAGSLKTHDWPQLDQLDNVIIGIRGAACTHSDDRTSRLSPERIAQWLVRFAV